MNYYHLNKPLGKNRFWVNRDETNEFIPNYADYTIWTLLHNKDYEIVEWKTPNLNYVDNNMMSMTITYDSIEDVKDYVIILHNDGTPFCYYPKPNDIYVYNKESEVVTVTYVLDKWSTYYVFKEALNYSDIQVLFRLKQKNRKKLNPQINEKNEYITIFDTNDYVADEYSEFQHTFRNRSSTDPLAYRYSDVTATKVNTYNLGEIKSSRAFKITFDYGNATLYGAGDSTGFPTLMTNVFSHKAEESFQLYAGESKEFIANINAVQSYNKVNGTSKITVALTQDSGNQVVTVTQVLSVTHDPNGYRRPSDLAVMLKPEYVNNMVLLMNDDILPPIEPVTDESQNKFYIDYQEQPWFNRAMKNEEIELLPIEKKTYDHEQIYDYYFNETYEEQFNWDKQALYRSADTTESKNINYLTLKPTGSETETVTFLSPIIKASNVDVTTYETATTQQYVSDDIFSRNGMYDYLVVMPSGVCRRMPLGSGEEITATDKLLNKNIWFLVPVTQYDGVFSLGSIWGGGNTMSKLKELPFIGSKNAVIKHYSLPIPPSYIAMVNKNIINEIYNVWDYRNYNLSNYWGMFTYQYSTGQLNEEEDIENNNVGIIPIKPETLKFFLTNNLFMTKTQEWIERMNQNIYRLPTTIENEPFLYSPHCLNMCIVPQFNDRITYLGNDYLNLKYTLNNIGIEALFLNSAILNYSANRLSDTRIISNAKNELAFDTGLDRPMDTNPYTDYLNGSATAESTSYQVLANNKNLLSKQIEIMIGQMFLGGSTNITGILSQMLSGAWGLGRTAITGGVGLKNQELQLKSQYNDIKVSSGTNVSLPPYCASCFASDSGLVMYTNFIREDLIDDVCKFRLANGYPVNMIQPFKWYDNRQKHNVIAIDVEHNYETIRKVLKEKVHGMLTSINDVFIKDFIDNYLTGVRLWKWDPEEETFDPYLCDNNYENNVWEDH